MLVFILSICAILIILAIIYYLYYRNKSAETMISLPLSDDLKPIRPAVKSCTPEGCVYGFYDKNNNHYGTCNLDASGKIITSSCRYSCKNNIFNSTNQFPSGTDIGTSAVSLNSDPNVVYYLVNNGDTSQFCMVDSSNNIITETCIDKASDMIQANDMPHISEFTADKMITLADSVCDQNGCNFTFNDIFTPGPPGYATCSGDLNYNINYSSCQINPQYIGTGSRVIMPNDLSGDIPKSTKTSDCSGNLCYYAFNDLQNCYIDSSGRKIPFSCYEPGYNNTSNIATNPSSICSMSDMINSSSPIVTINALPNVPSTSTSQTSYSDNTIPTSTTSYLGSTMPTTSTSDSNTSDSNTIPTITIPSDSTMPTTSTSTPSYLDSTIPTITIPSDSTIPATNISSPPNSTGYTINNNMLNQAILTDVEYGASNPIVENPVAANQPDLASINKQSEESMIFNNYLDTALPAKIASYLNQTFVPNINNSYTNLQSQYILTKSGTNFKRCNNSQVMIGMYTDENNLVQPVCKDLYYK